LNNKREAFSMSKNLKEKHWFNSCKSFLAFEDFLLSTVGIDGLGGRLGNKEGEGNTQTNGEQKHFYFSKIITGIDFCFFCFFKLFSCPCGRHGGRVLAPLCSKWGYNKIILNSHRKQREIAEPYQKKFMLFTMQGIKQI
jgi:hypothetical protein